MSPPDRLVLVAHSSRVPPGLFSWPAWQELRAGHVCVGDPAHPQLDALASVEVPVEVLPGDAGLERLAASFRSRARDGRSAVWLTGRGGDRELAAALGDLVAREVGAGGRLELEFVPGRPDLPGAGLLDAVATMDRLRSPGGCPWDAEQTHASLAPYLLEEAYEAVDAIERADPADLRDELGDVLLQVVFHSRLAQERDDGTGWSVDDVAAGLVEKLIRRHPHVFAGAEVTGVPDVLANWETIKAAEGRRTSAADGVALGAPALALAAKLQSRAASAGLAPTLGVGEVAAAETLPQAVAAAAAAIDESPGTPVEGIGDLLFAAVALARFHDVDPEAALRGTARRFRDRLTAVERPASESATVPVEPAEPSDEELLVDDNGPFGL